MSTLQSAGPRRTGTPGRSASGGVAEKPVEIDYLVNPEAYFEKLQQLKTYAEAVRKQDSDQEKTLMEYLPVNEKFNLNKEGKVIARWQERQRDWERIQAKIQRRLTSKVKKPLMMATADEFRARMEEYDLLQAAIPLKDRFSSSSWQVMLRGGGPIRVAVGHIFSGIECEVDLELPHPKMVRKPKPMSAVSKNDTFVDQSATYLHQKKKYQDSIREIRPHDLTYSEAGNLVMKSVNLFNWAKESSSQYYAAQRSQMEMDVISVGEVSAKMSGAQLDADSVGESASSVHGGDMMGSKIDFLSPKEVIFDSISAKSCTKTVSFRNCGSTAITYNWRHVPVSSAVRHDTSNATLNGVLNAKGTDEGALRARTLSKNRESFFCLREGGVILPEETVSTAFVFQSCASGGSFSSDWILEFNPEETSVYQVGENGSSAPGAVDSLSPPPMTVGSLTMRLKGHTITLDESSSKREVLSQFLDQGAVTAVARDIVFSCLRRVRDPVRLTDLQNRQIAHFRRTNAALLDALSARFTTMLPLFITPDRLDMFLALSQSACAAIASIKAVLAERRAQYAALPAASQQAGVDTSAMDMSNALQVTAQLQQSIRAVLFPEEIIEIFDEVTEEQLLPAWGYDLSAVLDALAALLRHCEEIADLEERLAEYEKAEQKARVKAARLAERIAALESDEELEPEEDEEEEAADEEDLPAKPVHPFVAQVQGLMAEVHSTLFLLSAHPLPEADIYDIASGIIGDLAESVVDHHLKALEVCELKEMVLTHGTVLPTLPSPFTSPEGAAAWKHALAQTSHIAEPEGGGKGKAPPKPAKGAPPPTEPTKLQVDFFYKTMYDGVRGSFLDAGVGMFGRVEETLQKESITPLKKYNASLERLFHVAVPRKDDVATTASGKIAFVSLNGGAFSAQNAVQSAFDVKQGNKIKAVSPVLRLVEHGAKAVVMVYESCITEVNPAGDAVLPHFDELKNLISQQWADFIAKTNKALRKLKQKPPQYKELVFSKYASFAEFYYHAEGIFKDEEASGSSKNGYFQLNTPIILIENTLVPGVIPPEPQLQEVLSDDDEAPVMLGVEESAVKRQQDWEGKRPHRVQVTLDLTGAASGAAKRSNASSKLQQPPTVKIECFAHAPSAIQEAVQLVSKSTSGAPLWVDAHLAKVFDPTSLLPTLERAVVPERLVSEEVREACLWSGLLQLLPQAADYLASAPAANAASSEDGSITTDAPAPTTRELIAQHFVRLFPYSAVAKKAPTAVVVLGGSIRAEKFAVLDQLIDLVDTVYLVGEFALPFLCLSKRFLFPRYAQSCARYHGICSTLLAKARMRGCMLRWPSDMVMGDLEVSPGDRQKCFLKFEPDARNEGADYEGEAKVFKVSDAEVDGGGVDPVVLSGFAYDIGPETCAALKAAVGAADLVVVWGAVGVCESSSFQAGQQCLVDCASSKPQPEPAAAPAKAAPAPAAGGKGAPAAAPAAPAVPQLTKNPLRTVLIGDATVEWFARMLDSDGELGGDLVGAGMVTYASRESSVFCGLLGLFPSRMAQGCITMREPKENEFVYSEKNPPEEEEEEEEEEEDEDD